MPQCQCLGGIMPRLRIRHCACAHCSGLGLHKPTGSRRDSPQSLFAYNIIFIAVIELSFDNAAWMVLSNFLGFMRFCFRDVFAVLLLRCFICVKYFKPIKFDNASPVGNS